MTVSANAGPLVVYGQTPAGSGATPDYNPNLGPSMFYAGVGILDVRAPYGYQPGQGAAATLVAHGMAETTVINAVPYTLAAAAVVASANPTGPALVLVSAGSATTGIGIVPSIVRADTGLVDTGVGGAGLVGIDCFTSVSGYISNGTSGTAGNLLIVTTASAGPLLIGALLAGTGIGSGVVVTGYGPSSGTTGSGTGFTGSYTVSGPAIAAGTSGAPITITGTLAAGIPNMWTRFGSVASPMLWNPQALIGRCLSYTAAAGATYTTATTNGYDFYGYPLTESVTLTAGGSVNGKKAFKYVRSVTLSGGSADTTHAYSIGTTDIYGLPVRADSFGELLINYAGSLTATTLLTAATGFTAAVTTPATATTGDVRGTYALQTAAATGTNRLIVKQTPQPYNLLAGQTGLWGQPQFSAF